MPVISGVSGLASGIDSTAIIDSLMKVARTSTTMLENRGKTLQTKLDLLRQFNTKLLTTKLDLIDLRKTSTFATPSATTSNATALTATATSTAQAGTFQVYVDKIATAHQLVTAGVSDPNISLGTGTVKVQVGTNAAATVTVDANNGTLNGLADSINKANLGVTAQVINDGGATPYRLSISSTSTGAASAISMDMSGLTGGASDQARGVTAVTSGADASALSLSGFSTTGTQYQVKTQSDGLGGFTYAVSSSTDHGTTWGAYGSSAAVTSDPVTLESGVTLKLSAGKLRDNDVFTVAPTRQVSAAQDASIRYGSGTSPLTVTSASNTISNLIPGVTLNVLAKATDPITVTVGANSGDAKTALKTLIADYNGLMDFWKTNGSFNSTTGKAGALFGETALKRNLNELAATLTGTMPGIGSFNSIDQVGISWDYTNGHLTMNETTFDAKMKEDPNAVAKIFANSGSSSSTQVQFITVGDKTSIDAPFSVKISRAATQAVLSSTMGSTTIADGANTLNVTLNGVTKKVALAVGSYTQQTLATQVQTAINTAFNSPALAISASVNSGQLQLRSTAFGSNQAILIDNSGAGAQLGFLSTSSARGIDVAGTINGQVATGLGQVLQGATGTTAEGLVLLATANAPLSGVTITAHKGLIQQFDSAIRNITDVGSGILPDETDSLSQQIDDITATVKKQDDILATRKSRLQAQFLAMETAISKFNNMSTYLNTLSGTTSSSSSSSSKKSS